MIWAFDTHYIDDRAKTVGLSFREWTDAEPEEVLVEITENPAEYEPGSFYKRELPCILSLLKQIDLNSIRAIVVDGYVLLDDSGKMGLGGHLFHALDGNIPIIGVAKTHYAQLGENHRQVLRGASRNPLFVTAMGMELDGAAAHILDMHGDFRMPTLLKQLDSQTKAP